MRGMGTDIHGVVECRPGFAFRPDEDDPWESAVDLSLLYAGRDYDLFGCLFGVQNLAGFAPVAAERGLPADAARRTREDLAQFSEQAHSVSWLDGSDLAAIDLDEPAVRVDARIHRYIRGADNAWVYHSKAGQDPAWADATGHSLDQDGSAFPEGAEWLVGDRLYRVERLRCRDVIGGEWSPVFEVMRILIDLHGPRNVRLVVWFDA